jgi:hypothetical protein
MTPSEFKARYIRSLPNVPPELDLRLDEFFTFPKSEVEELNVPEGDKDLLATSGLPKTPPSFTFGLSPKDCLRPMNEEYGVPAKFGRYRMIGANAYGDMVCLDEAAGGRMVYLNHDRNMEVVFINSTVQAFAHSLCAFAEYLWRHRSAEACRAEIQAVDPTAMQPGAYWPSEIDTDEAHN